MGTLPGMTSTRHRLLAFIGMALILCGSTEAQVAHAVASQRQVIVIAQSSYYAKHGKADEACRWCPHAGDVRARLGFPRVRGCDLPAGPTACRR